MTGKLGGQNWEGKILTGLLQALSLPAQEVQKFVFRRALNI